MTHCGLCDVQITQNLPEKIQKTTVAPESIGAKANARNSGGPESFNNPNQ